MEFHSAKQISPENLNRIDYDLFILAAGYEQRSIYLLVDFNINAKVKVALAFEEKSREVQRRNNDVLLLEKGFRSMTFSGEQSINFDPLFSKISENSLKDNIFVLIDYSSMTKVWYSGIINYLIGNENIHKKTIVHFSYTPALYNEPKKAGAVKFNTPVSFPSRKSADPNKPTALIIGLGLDYSRAEFLQRNLKPELTLLLYADPTNEVKYVEMVFKNNEEIIEQSGIRNLLSFPLDNLERTNEILTDLCLSLRAKYNVIVAPIGPKALTLLALLLSVRYPDISVVRISQGAGASTFERKPCCKPLVYSVEFTPEESE